MTANNLAIVFGTNLVYLKTDELLKKVESAKKAFELLLINKTKIFE